MNDLNHKTATNIFTKLMSMDEAAWERHANPFSVWSRAITGLPVILGAIWSIRPFGWWSILFILSACFWIWINPRLFSVPKHTDNWASKVTFGERIWLNRKFQEIPAHHANWAFALSLIAGIGFIVAVVSAYLNLLLPTLVGGVISWFGKMWFCDRMVWLFHDTLATNEKYKHWLR